MTRMHALLSSCLLLGAALPVVAAPPAGAARAQQAAMVDWRRDLHRHPLLIVGLGIPKSRPGYAGSPDHCLVAATVIDEKLIAFFHRAQMLKRRRIADAIPDGVPLFFQVRETKRGRLGL